MITIVIADDHPVVRQGLGAVISLQPEYQVVGEAGNGIDALALVESLRPDVLVVDLMMPTLGGLEVVRQVAERYPATRSVVLSMHSNEAYVLEALRNGAIGVNSRPIDTTHVHLDVVHETSLEWFQNRL
jgi:two-component system response regulator NreC